MTLDINEIAAHLANPIGKQVFLELHRQDWSQPFYRNDHNGKFSFGAHPGFKRGRNDDRVLFATISILGIESYSIAVLCDGVGGTTHGDVAAEIAISSIISRISSHTKPISVDKLLDDAIRTSDHEIRSILKGKGATTISLVLASASSQVIGCNVGDSRIFSWNPAKRKLMQISVDDTLENELRALKVNNPPALALRGMGGSLSQALGESGTKSEDLRLNFHGPKDFEEGFLLGSDGLWKVNQDAFLQCVDNTTSALEATRRLVQLSLLLGGVDNASVFAAESIDQLIERAQAAQESSLGRVTLRMQYPQDSVILSWAPEQSENPQEKVLAASTKTRRKAKQNQKKVLGKPSPTKIPEQQEIEISNNPAKDEIQIEVPDQDI